jgi:surface polysaccharide O-acyltransferase-like enzyme
MNWIIESINWKVIYIICVPSLFYFPLFLFLLGLIIEEESSNNQNDKSMMEKMEIFVDYLADEVI